MERIEDLKIKIFADGANKDDMLAMHKKPYIKGFTTNLTLMRKAGINDYKKFAKSIVKEIPDLPISFEVFSDDFGEMERQAFEIAEWGKNVYVKIPVTNTNGKFSGELIYRLSKAKVKLNVTALMTIEQVCQTAKCLSSGTTSFISLFAGRVADTGIDPVLHMKKAIDTLRFYPDIELIWASPRELLNIFQANSIGCQIITVTSDILAKIPLIGKNLNDFSLDTVKMFHDDAKAAGFKI